MRLIQRSDMSTTDIIQQQSYHNMLQDVGNQTKEFIETIDNDSNDQDMKTLKLPFQNNFVTNSNTNDSNSDKILDDSLHWLYENGFNHDKLI